MEVKTLKTLLKFVPFKVSNYKDYFFPQVSFNFNLKDQSVSIYKDTLMRYTFSDDVISINKLYIYRNGDSKEYIKRSVDFYQISEIISFGFDEKFTVERFETNLKDF